MTHIVIHDDDSNVTHYAEFDDVQAAAAYLEDLVNRDGGSNARLFALEPVEFAVKSYVRVEIPGAAPAAGTVAAGPVDTAVEEVAPAELPTMAVATEAPIDDTVEYVEAAMASADAFAPITPVVDVGEVPNSGEPRRGLFGR